MRQGIEAGSFEMFAHDWQLLGAKGDPKPKYDELVERYSDGSRHYHSWTEHIIPGEKDMGVILAAHPSSLKRAESRMGWRFHDVIQNPRRELDQVSVEKSALYLEQVFKSVRVPKDLVREMADLVRVTNHINPTTSFMQRLIVDTDLAIFGKDQETFDRYEDGIEKEYAFVEKQKFVEERLKIMERFRLSAIEGTVFYLQYFKDHFGKQSIDNLNRSVAKLEERKVLLNP